MYRRNNEDRFPLGGWLFCIVSGDIKGISYPINIFFVVSASSSSRPLGLVAMLLPVPARRVAVFLAERLATTDAWVGGLGGSGGGAGGGGAAGGGGKAVGAGVDPPPPNPGAMVSCLSVSIIPIGSLM